MIYESKTRLRLHLAFLMQAFVLKTVVIVTLTIQEPVSHAARDMVWR